MNRNGIHRRTWRASRATLLAACLGMVASSLATAASPVAAATPPPPADFDGDGDSDVSVFRPSAGVWFVDGGATTAWGTAGDVPVPADYDGDGDDDIAVYRPSAGVWFVQGGATTAWGTAGDVPVPADYDGDGDDDIAVYRQSIGLWFVNGGATTAWGTVGDLPQPGNYDADAATEQAVFRPASGLWFIHGGPTVAWGTGGDVPVVLPASIHAHAADTALAPGPRLLGAAPEGDDKVKLTFDRALAPSAADPARYSSSPDLLVQAATLLNASTEVLLSTGPHYQVSYTVAAGNGVTDGAGNAVDPAGNTATFTGTRPINGERPRVTSAGSTGNTKVLVQFSKPMADNALQPNRYSIVQENVNPEVGAVAVTEARFAEPDRLLVELTTLSQNEVTYRVKVTGVTDLAGNPLADRTTVNGVLVDPTSATFAGTPPTGQERVDTDGDGLFDHEETLGWSVVVRLATGASVARQVTSTPLLDDTDGDGLNDFLEKSLTIDPRDDDTDDDGLSDEAEFNDIYSDPTQQDSDQDGVTDGLEVTFFRTSATLSDTDGDQLDDGAEINLANRNPRVADLPKPGLEIGRMNLALDVRFTDSTASETRVVDEKTATSSLAQSERREFSTSEASTVEASTKLASEIGHESSISASAGTDAGVEVEESWSFKTSAEHSFGSSFMSSFTSTSSEETERAYEDSLRSEKETSAGATRTREVQGARAQVAVVLKSGGNIAFTIKNLQVTALIQDPQDPGRLTPVATLLPDAEPDSGYSLGPLVPERGPILFSNDQVFPQMVEDLMRNPRGLVFRFSNYDIVDELERNFAFTSQDINDRTARIAIDHGGFDGDGDGIGDSSEIVRVATGMGRQIDGRPVVYDEHGRQVGTTLRDALQAMGLKEYDERTPGQATSDLTQDEIDNSYSVRKYWDNTREQIFRIRRTKLEDGVDKVWEILTPAGIDRTLGLDDRILQPGGTVTLAFLQDTDEDHMPALFESINNCMDSPVDADGDGRADSVDSDGDTLDDRFEVLVGWTATTERGSRDVRSRCSVADTDGDGLTDDFEAPAEVQRDDEGLIMFDTNHKPERDRSTTPDPILGHSLADPITSPTSADTDFDGLEDGPELTPRKVKLRSAPGGPETFTPLLVTSPEFFDSDRDTGSDGIEEELGGNPREPDFANFGDSDGDGLVDAQEDDGWDVDVEPTRARVRSQAAVCTGTCGPPDALDTRRVTSDENKADSDTDGLSDLEEYDRRTDPTRADTDDDGLLDREEVHGFELRGLAGLVTDPVDADTDNDKRSDGEEADRLDHLHRDASHPSPVIIKFVIRVPGTPAYQAFSHPLEPDADLDNLVDGDELSWGSDPTKPNTDDDNRSDFSEVMLRIERSPGAFFPAPRRPDVPDLRVEAVFGAIKVDKDADTDDNAGDFTFDLGASKQVNAQNPWVPVSNNVIVFTSDHDQWPNLGNCGNNLWQSLCKQPTREIRIADGSLLRSAFDRTVDVGTVSTTDALPEQLNIVGQIVESDPIPGGGTGPDCFLRFPETWSVDAASRGIVPGSALKPGIQPLALKRAHDCEGGGQIDLTLHVAYRAT